MEKANTLEFVKKIDNNDIFIESEPVDESPIFNGLFHEYEKVVVRSLITSFGLDAMLFKDRRGGDVDTINTVRDKTVIDYADKRNQYEYQNREDYDSDIYHKHKNYIEKNAQISQQKKSGNLYDAYTGKKVSPNANIDLDHTIAAKEIHDDPGRVLADLNGADLANAATNLNATDSSINRSKKAKTVDEFLGKIETDSSFHKERINELKSKDYLSDKERKELNKYEKLESVDAERIRAKDKTARKDYEQKLAVTYYTSSKFLKATAQTSLISGGKMGLRQCLGFILAETWFTVKEDFPSIIKRLRSFELKDFLKEIAETVKKVFKNIREKYKELIASFQGGVLAGILSSISSTLINIFFTTAKFAGRILRESWASIVESVKILVYNPDNLPFGERLRAVAKIIATCVSVVCGGLVQEAISKMNPIKLPLISDVLPEFIGGMTTGIMTVSMLYFLDHSKQVQNIVEFANKFKSEIEHKLEYYREVNIKLTEYVAKLATIDYESLEEEVKSIRKISIMLESAVTTSELNEALHKIVKLRKISLPYETIEELDLFMNDRDAILVI